LPKDTEVVGFDNAAEVQQPSELRIARFEAIANLYAEAATGSEQALREWVHCDWRAAVQGAEDCGAQFVREAGFVFFRRPLTQDELGWFVLRFDTTLRQFAAMAWLFGFYARRPHRHHPAQIFQCRRQLPATA
jgi:hypothetical protein